MMKEIPVVQRYVNISTLDIIFIKVVERFFRDRVSTLLM
jgi:hypothetical protein